MKTYLSVLALFFLGWVNGYSQLYITASGGNPSDLRFTVNQDITFTSNTTFSAGSLVLEIFDAYTSPQSTVIALSMTGTAVLELPQQTTDFSINSGRLFGTGFLLVFQDDLSQLNFSEGDQFILKAGTLNFNNTGMNLPDNLSNASFTMRSGQSGITVAGPIANAIPEPASAGLLLLAGGALLLRRKVRV